MVAGMMTHDDVDLKLLGASAASSCNVALVMAPPQLPSTNVNSEAREMLPWQRARSDACF